MTDAEVVAAPSAAAEGDSAPADDSLGLPNWLEEIMKPGVGSGVFMTLKGSLVGLICCLVVMLLNIEEPAS